MPNKLLILLAEDNENELELFKLVLSQITEEVALDAVRDGQEVIDYLERKLRQQDKHGEQIPDLLVLDLKMPRVTGLEVLKWLNHHSELASIPTIILSGSGLDADVEEAYELRAQAYFQKPSGLSELRKLMRAMLDCWVLTERF